MAEYGLFDRSTTARDRASSSGAYAEPNLYRPRLDDGEDVRDRWKASPSARKVSSVVWWSSTGVVC